ncbi:NACHT domain-containing protein [Anthocerotibacter panamensis]|uniref:NACHT domain-containing protein n=1 Tax=Anthocerotibacter panamensis TaxID=2857077 RepID=UPI001C404541|nr:NACHT domain-containing protein [Anthocerotibacter panamensis]
MADLDLLLQIAVPVFQGLWHGRGKAIQMFQQSLDERMNQVLVASRQYVRNYEKRHGILKVLGMREPIALEAVYVAVQFLHDQDVRRFATLDALEEAYRKNQKRGFQTSEAVKQEGIAVANEKQYLMVLGGPGAGKSTFLRKMGLEALKGKAGGYEHACIPVFIELKQFAACAIELEQAIVEEFRICGFPAPEAFTEAALKQGKLLILLDGLDEVPSRGMVEVIGQVQDFVSQYQKNRFIASCRPAAYRGNFARFTDVAVSDFEGTQIEQFIQNWFQAEADQEARTAQKCWKLLCKPEHAAARELAQTPLLLTLLCLVYDNSQDFPKKRGMLYRKALRILLEEWAAEKRIQQDKIYRGLNTELEEILLSEIAYTGFEADRLFFSKREVVSYIKGFLASNLNAPRHLDGEAILNAIAIQQGILVERAEDVFSFSHLTLQEYLTAQHIDDHHLTCELVTHHLTDKRWEEVFLLVAGISRIGADELLVQMEAQAQYFLQSPRLQGLLQWAASATAGSPANLSRTAQRAAALFLALGLARGFQLALTLAQDPDLFFALDLERTRSLVLDRALILERTRDFALKLDAALGNTLHLAHALATDPALGRNLIRALSLAHECKRIKIFKSANFADLIARLNILQAQVPDFQQPMESRVRFVERTRQAWFGTLGLSPELVDLCEPEEQALGDYLYVSWLLVQCKQAAVRLSPKTWAGIEERMLMVAAL